MQNVRLLPLLPLLLLLGCRKNELINNVTIEEAPPKILVISSFKGKVLDENGQPVSGAVVSVFENNTTTNDKGLFELKNVKSPKDAALVRVQKTGYFTGSSMSGNKADGQHYVQVTLMKKAAAQSVNAVTGGVTSWPGGLKVTIAPNTLRRINGALFTGQASITARWIDPKGADLGSIMPGALMARNEKGQEKVLATYGMVALEMKEPNGQELLVKDNETVQVEMEIPTELAASAPQEIDVWYFDLEEERWLLKGTCLKSGSAYSYGVSSGGYWNCDVALEPICLSGTFFQSDSTPALYLKVIVEDLTDNFIYWGYTDINGYFCGSVPKGAPLKITVKDLCDNILYEANIGPYSVDTNLGDIYLTQALQQYMIHISGTLNDCSGMPAAEQQIVVRYPGRLRIFPTDASGAFNINLALNCIEFPELEITGYDLTTFKATPVQFHSDDSDFNLGVLAACADPEDYMRLSVDGQPYNMSPTRAYLKNNVTTNWMVLEGLTTGGLCSIDLRQYAGIGTYTVNTFFHLNNYPETPLYPALDSSSPDITVTITAEDDNLVIGNLSGIVYDVFATPHTLSGYFKIKK